MHHTGQRSSRRGALALAATAIVAGGPLAGAAPAHAATPGELNGGDSSPSTSSTLSFGRWNHFSVGGTGSTTGIFTFSSDSPVLLRVTDAFCRGDEFRVYDRGYALFNTSAVATDPSCDDDPLIDTAREAWADPSYSKGRFLLQPGHHWVRIQITDSPFGGAGAFLRIDERPVS